MRSPTLPTASVLGVFLMVAACSGSADNPLTTESPSTTMPPNGAPADAPPAAAAPGANTSNAPGSPASDAGGGAAADGGTGTGTGAGTGTGTGTGGILGQPYTDCAGDEVEPNDTAETANAITGASFCGKLETPADVDFLSFVMPTDIKSYNIGQQHTAGGMTFEVIVDGVTYPLPPPIPPKPGATYLVRASTKGNRGGYYRIGLTLTR